MTRASFLPYFADLTIRLHDLKNVLQALFSVKPSIYAMDFTTTEGANEWIAHIKDANTLQDLDWIETAFNFLIDSYPTPDYARIKVAICEQRHFLDFMQTVLPESSYPKNNILFYINHANMKSLEAIEKHLQVNRRHYIRVQGTTEKDFAHFACEIALRRTHHRPFQPHV